MEGIQIDQERGHWLAFRPRASLGALSEEAGTTGLGAPGSLLVERVTGASDSSSLSFTFLVCKMGMMITIEPPSGAAGSLVK